jgi:tRNA(fMet)-specific endonuclease VapC
MLVFDTDHMSLLEWAESPEFHRLHDRLQHSFEETATTIISYEEQARGWLAYIAKARTVGRLIEAYGKLNRHLNTYRKIRVLEFDERAATEFQHIRKLPVRVGTMDLKIAAIVLVHGAKLLSRNLADFRKIPSLDVEDWTI